MWTSLLLYLLSCAAGRAVGNPVSSFLACAAGVLFLREEQKMQVAAQYCRMGEVPFETAVI
jgi:hypothetical protein